MLCKGAKSLEEYHVHSSTFATDGRSSCLMLNWTKSPNPGKNSSYSSGYKR